MTEVSGNNGYNGYVAGNPQPQLKGCNNADTNKKDTFKQYCSSLINRVS